MNVKIFEVSENDALFLCKLMNDKNILDSLNEVPTQLSDWIDAISAWNCDDDEEGYIIFDEETPIGWLGVNGLSSENKKAYIKMIVLLPEYQNKGIGSYVVTQLVRNLKLRKFKEIILYTNQNNLRAQKCYAKCGFEVTKGLIQKMFNGDMVRRCKMEMVL